jgi:hypothetical protein
MSSFNKVIGIGLPKTATSSLAGILSANGVPTIHFGNTGCEEIRHKMYRGIYIFDIFEKYRGVINAFEMIFPQIDKEYPNSKFIHTIRDKDAWLYSVKLHWERAMANSVAQLILIHHHLITFGTYLFNEDRFAFVYDMHANMVKDYFKDRKNDLLVIDITKDQEYVYKVCGFLNIPVINNTALHFNRG